MLSEKLFRLLVRDRARRAARYYSNVHSDPEEDFVSYDDRPDTLCSFGDDSYQKGQDRENSKVPQ